MTKKGTTEVYVQGPGKVGKDRNFTMEAKPCLPLYPEYSSRLTTLKMPTTMNPNRKLFSPAAKAQKFWIMLEACGKNRGIQKYQHGHGMIWFDDWKGALNQRSSAQLTFPKLLVWPWNCLLLPMMKKHSMPQQCNQSNIIKMVKRAWGMPALHAKGRDSYLRIQTMDVFLHGLKAVTP